MNVVFFLGPAFERWSPLTLEHGGAGGSESMAWALASRLAQRGHHVRVFAESAGLTGIFGGVAWHDWSSYPGTSCDVLIASRRPEALDPERRIKAKHTLFWAHDAHYDDTLTPERAARYQHFLVLSEWHAGLWHARYPATKDRTVIVRNGIDRSLFAGGAKRDPHRLIYSSSPDRGLDIALSVMPAVRARVVDASLHVFYGFETLSRRAERSEDAGLARYVESLQRRLKSYERFGVVFHGRKGPTELAVEFLKSGTWGYPTAFFETSCITAMQAQAAGCRIVTSPRGALTETVGTRGTMIAEPLESPAYAAAYGDAVVAALTQRNEDDRETLAAYAREHFDLEKLADHWDDMLRTLERP